jgi:hypothetical protein
MGQGWQMAGQRCCRAFDQGSARAFQDRSLEI